MKIGIIGNGFVGNSIAFGFSPTHEIRVHDKDPKRNLNTLEEVLECDFIFVAVPTPMNEDGSISLKVVEKALQEIDNKNKKNNVVILKSTMIPGSTNNFVNQFPKLNIVFNPEFLTERTAKLDFLTQARIILGGEKNHTSKVKQLFEADLLNSFDDIYKIKYEDLINLDRFKNKSAIIFLMAVLNAGTDGTIRGKITDDQGAPLPGANIYVPDVGAGAAADFDGNYIILNIPVGQYDVVCQMMGYAKTTTKGVNVVMDQTVWLNFKLRPEVVEGESVEVLGTRPLV